MPHERLRPGTPGGAAVNFLQSHKQTVIRQPAFVFRNEGFIGLVRAETVEGQFQDIHSVGILGTEIHSLRVIAPVDGGNLLLGQQSLLGQGVQINEIVVSGTGGKGLVGGIAVACWGQRQNLPAGLTRLFQKVHKSICLFSHSADPVGPRQGCDVHQNTALAHWLCSPYIWMERMLSRESTVNGTVSWQAAAPSSIAANRISTLRFASWETG